MKAKLSVDRGMMALLGSKLYTKHRVTIAVRELEQNAKDACRRAGVVPDVHISIEYFEDDRVVVVCSDNGCGMDQDTIVNKLLCLGASSKAGTKETGQFGVAKAVFMCGEYFFCHTLDNVLDSQTIEDELEIAKTDMREGTLVQVEYKGKCDPYYWIDDAIAILAFSSTPTHFIYRRYGKEVYNGEIGGLTNLMLMKSMDSWTGSGVDEVRVFDRVFKGHCVVRLNGLVQHLRYRSWNETMHSNLIVDLDSHLAPTDPDFPMVMSREKLIGKVENEVNEWHSFNTENPISTDVIIQRKITAPNIKYTSGHLFEGKRDPENSLEEEFREITDRDDSVKDSITRFLGAAGRTANEVDQTPLDEFYDPDSNFPLLRLFDYDFAQDDIERDVNFITTWARIIENVLTKGITFGVGLMGGRSSAEMVTVEGVVFFCINPRMHPVQPMPEAQILAMWCDACHEVAHMSVEGHNENHSALTAFLETVTAYSTIRDMKNLVKLLKEG